MGQYRPAIVLVCFTFYKVMDPINIVNTGPERERQKKMVLGVSADAMTPDGVKPSSGTLLTTKLDMQFSTSLVIMILNSFSLIGWKIQNGWRDLVR